MTHYYRIGHEPGPAYDFDTDPGPEYVLWEDKPAAKAAPTESAPKPENEV